MEFFLKNSGYVLNDSTSIWSRPNYEGIPYSDGDGPENQLAAFIQQAGDVSLNSEELPHYCTDWFSLYHLSKGRANILRPFEKSLEGASILEIGAGCGAITRYLGEVTGTTVLALEGSLRRAAIARSRTRDLSNVTVVAEKFSEFKPAEKFDFVTLIGVLEYANLFTPGEHPAAAMLKQVRSLLKPEGKVIIAIENQLGLKYFAGAPEDHLGQPMVGIEGRYQKNQPETFGQEVLEKLLEEAGFKQQDFLAPFPDYKFPVSIITEQGMKEKDFDAAAFAWQSVRLDPQLPSACHFSLELAWGEVFKNKLGLPLANSFLVVASFAAEKTTDISILAYHYSKSRKIAYSKEVLFYKEEDEITVSCRPFSSSLVVNGNNPLIKYILPKKEKYIPGMPLSFELIKKLTADQWSVKDIAQFLERYMAILKQLVSSQESPQNQLVVNGIIDGCFFDAIPQNIILDKNQEPHLFDKEWVLLKPLEYHHLLFRALVQTLDAVRCFGSSPDIGVSYYELIDRSFRAVGIALSEEDYNRYFDLENQVQNEVTNNIAIHGLSYSKARFLSHGNTALLLEQFDKQVNKKNLVLEQKEEQLREKKQEVEERELQISKLQLVLKEREDQLAEKIDLIRVQELEIENKSDHIIAANARIAKIKKNILSRWTFKFLEWDIREDIRNRMAIKEIAKSGLFDREWYLKQNPDVATIAMDPLVHYVVFGEKEKRNPNPLFDIEWYLDKNSDVREAGVSLLGHYVKHGWKEGRSPNEYFNVTWYLKENSDVERSQQEPLAHYQKHGWKEGRFPNPFFDVAWYLKKNKQVLASGEEPLSHYVAYLNKEFLATGKKRKSYFNLEYIVGKKHGPKVSLSIVQAIRGIKELEHQESGSELYQKAFDALKETIREFRQKKSASHGKPEISIIIPVHNQVAYTLACVVSILEATTKHSYEILIGDDASTDSSYTRFSGLDPAISVVRHESNLGFLKNCNETAKKAEGKYILLLNNDTLVLPGWSDALLETFKNRPEAGLVGAKLLNADGTLQEAGGIIWNDGSGWNYGRGDDLSKPEYNYLREVDYCSGACLMIPTELWKSLGGFDERYSPAYYEDTDLAFKVRKSGKKVYYQPLSELIHHEGVSHGKDTTKGIKSYQLANQKKFVEYWKEELTLNHLSPRTPTFSTRTKTGKSKTILFVDHGMLTPDKDAGSKSVLSYMNFFMKQGFHVLFIADNYLEMEPYTNNLRQMGVEVLIGKDFLQHTTAWFEKNGENIGYAFLCRSHTSFHWIEPLRKHTKAKILFYGVDLISRTRGRAYRDTGLSEHKKLAEQFKKYEDAIHKVADAIFYPSQAEVDYLATTKEAKKIKKIPLYTYENEREQPAYHAASRDGLLFVGGFRHPPNLDAVNLFLKEIFPKVLKSLPEIKVTIVGANVPPELQCLESSNIGIESNVSDERLTELINTTKVSIAPLRFGGGIKGKIVDALYYGVPVITTEIGAEGLESEGQHMIVTSLENFAEELIKAYTNNAFLDKISAAGLAYIDANFSEEAMKHALGKDVSGIS